MAQNIDVIGVRAIFADLPQFLRNSFTFNKELKNLDKNVKQIGAGAKESQGAGLNPLVALLTKPLSLGTLGLAAAIKGVASEIAGLSSIALEGAAAMQQFEVRFKNLVAVQIIEAGQAEDFANAQELAIGPTKELLGWIQDLALTTPFSFDSVANTIAFSMAMGQSEQQAKDLTLAIGNFTSGMGLNDEVMKRIIFNFGQMIAAGKVTGTELRDLPRGAFFPINTILKQMAENMNIAVENMTEFRKQVSEGQVDVNQFIKAFEDVVAKRMPEAMKEMNKTWPAIINNIKDFIQIVIGINVLGPIFNRITDRLASLLEVLNDPKVKESARTIGLALGLAFDSIMEGIRPIIGAFKQLIMVFNITAPSAMNVAKVLLYIGTVLKLIGTEIGRFVSRHVVPFVQGIQEKLAGGLGDAANNALHWGYNIVSQLAEGMVKGAAAAITAAIRFIQNLLTSWFQANSPPKILADIVEWGAATMAAFLEGFSQADFGALDSVQNALKGALDSLVALGQLKSEDVGQIFVDISEDLIRAIDQFNQTGQISEDVFDQLRAIGGGFGEELADLLDLQLQLNIALEAQAAAEKALKDAQEARVNAGKAVNAAIRAYNDALRKGASKDALKSQLQVVNAAENQLHTAVDQEKIAEANKKAADDMVDVLKEQVKLQETLLQQLIELAKAQAQAAAGGGGGGPEFPPEDGGGFGGIDLGGGELESSLEDLLKRMKEKIEQQIGAIWQSLKDKWNEIIGPVLTAIADLWDTFVNGIGGKWNSFRTAFTNAFNAIAAEFRLWLAFFEGWWAEHGESVIGIITFIWDTIKKILSKVWEVIVDAAKNIWGNFKKWWVKYWPDIREFVQTELEILGDWLDFFWALIQGDTETALKELKEIWDGTWKAILLLNKIVFGTLLEAAHELFLKLKDATVKGMGFVLREFVDFLSDIIVQFAFWSVNILEIVTGNWNALWAIYTMIFATLSSAWNEFLTGIQTAWAIGWETVKFIAETILAAIIMTFVSFFDDLTQPFGQTMTDIGGIWSNAWSAIQSVLGIALDAIGIALSTGVENAKNAIVNGLNAIPAALANISASFTGIGNSIIQGIISGVNAAAGALATVVRNAIAAAIEAAKDALGIGSPSKVFMQMGKNITAGMMMGISGGANALQNAMVGMANMTMNPILSRTASAAPVSSNRSVVFGDMVVNNGMDAAVLRATIRSEVTRMMR